jgi:DNA repair protein RadA/Sms
LRASKTLAPSEYLLNSPPTPIDAIVLEDMERRQIGMAEMDRVLGGGIVQGSAVLVGGDPGIGKSTLLLQILQNLAAAGLSVLYISGEESANQIKMRGKRIGAQSPNILVLVEIALEKILDGIASLKPSVVVVDSIQTIYSAELSSAPGSVGQVRECSERLILLSKKTGIPLFLIGHVTKDGSIAGPKVLEHMVDTVLYFEGDSGHAYRIIRSIKNRFGPANEIGVFEMKDSGLAEVGNPSAFFLSERPEGAAGSVVAASMEGTRPILIEIQALAGPSNLGMPRRTVIGTDNNRVSLLVAVLEKICGMHLGNHDVFINIAGGVKVNEPGIDLGIVAAIASSFLNRAIDPQTVVFGEVGLTGEIRGIGRMEDRIKEAGRMGFGRCIFPKTSREDKISIKGMQAARVGKLEEFLAELF